MQSGGMKLFSTFIAAATTGKLSETDNNATPCHQTGDSTNCQVVDESLADVATSANVAAVASSHCNANAVAAAVAVCCLNADINNNLEEYNKQSF